MNIKALIKKYEAVECVVGIVSGKTILKSVLRDLQQLDEPEKVKVPQFVADWYEENKDFFEFNVWDWIAFRDEAKKLENREFNNWVNDSRENPIQTLVNMHQFGYEVEKEKRYRVKLKSNSEEIDYLVDTKANGFRFFSNIYTQRREHTRKEIEEAGFGWVFDCEGIEIEEVQE